MKPTIGRIVHYKLYGSHPEVVPAIITRVHTDTCVNLRVFSDSAPHNAEFFSSVGLGDLPGQWNWPLRAEESPKAVPIAIPPNLVP